MAIDLRALRAARRPPSCATPAIAAALGMLACTVAPANEPTASGGAGTTSTTSATGGGGTSSGGGGGGGGATGAGGTAGAGGAGTAGAGGAVGCGDVAGCSDCTREAYVDVAAYPLVAACAGGFAIAGTKSIPSQSPACGLQGGDNGPYPSGQSTDGTVKCSIADLCASGWHVCSSEGDLAVHVVDCPPDMPPHTFWATRQGQDQNEACSADGVNNVMGCGTDDIGVADACATTDRALKTGGCATDSIPWDCGVADNAHEAIDVTKTGPEDGGALCCKD